VRAEHARSRGAALAGAREWGARRRRVSGDGAARAHLKVQAELVGQVGEGVGDARNARDVYLPRRAAQHPDREWRRGRLHATRARRPASIGAASGGGCTSFSWNT